MALRAWFSPEPGLRLATRAAAAAAAAHNCAGRGAHGAACFQRAAAPLPWRRNGGHWGLELRLSGLAVSCAAWLVGRDASTIGTLLGLTPNT